MFHTAMLGEILFRASPELLSSLVDSLSHITAANQAMSQDMQICITPVDMLHKDSMQPHGRKGFDRYAGAVACVDSYAGAMSGLGESRSDSSDGLRVWLKIMHRSASSSAPAADQQRHQQRPSTNSEVERIFGHLDNLTRQKRNPSS